jgi:hypothetical protein
MPETPKTKKHESVLAELLRDIDRYLAAVALFRAEGCEPTWLAERTAVFAAAAPPAAGAA